MSEVPLIDIRPDHWGIVRDILRKHVPQYAVWAFGSRAKWTAKEYSDLDLTIITDEPLPLSISAALDEDFSESDLPWKVDVVDWASTSTSFQKIIERDKVVVQEKERRCSVMNDWSYANLGDVCQFRAGSVFPLALQGQSIGSYPFIKVSDMNLAANVVRIQDAANWIDDEKLQQLKAKPFPPGTTVFAKIGEALKANRLRYIIRPTIIDNNMMGAIPSSDTVDGRFFFYALSQVDFGEIAGGSALPYLTVDALSKLEMAIPTLSEQRAIAHILGTLDDKIELNRQQNKTLEEMARALFKAWFVDFEPVRAKMEGRWQRGQSLPGLPAHLYDLFPSRLIETEWGEIPEGWRVEVYSEIVEIIGGGTPKTSVNEYWNGEIPWFSVVDTPASSDVFVVGTEKSITRAGFENSSVRMVEKGVTIISARGTVGNLAIAGRDMTFNQSCYALCGKNGFGSYFVFLSAQHMVEQLKAMAHGSVFSTITRKTFDAVKVVLPPEVLLGQFEKGVVSLFDAILGNVNESRTLAQLRDTLLPKLISGELRVADAATFLKEHGVPA